jgi:hypothetical protein
LSGQCSSLSGASNFGVRFKPAHLARFFVYGSLVLALGIALFPGQGQSRSAQNRTEPLDAKTRATYETILTHYLSSLPSGAPPAALAALKTTDPDTLGRLITWLPTPNDQRPNLLFDSALPLNSPLFPALLEAAFIGHLPPPLAITPTLLQKLPLDKADPLRLHLLQALATRAASDQQPRVQHYLLSEAARHPAASWTHVQTLIDHAIATQVTDEAIALLSDWLDDPPTPHDPKQINTARLALAHLHLTAKHPDEAANLLAPLIENQTQPNLEALDLAWTLAGLTQNPAPLIAPIESLLRRYPQHQLNWRELASTPAPDPTYLLWLDRLANACTETQNDARAVELGLHLATLVSPTKLLPILPAAARIDRFPEVLDLLDRLEKTATTANQPSPTLTLAETCYQQQDTDSARRLLEHRLEQTPAHLPTLRLSLQVKSHALPPMQTAILWRRHLQNHPDDLFAHQLLVDAWLAANQPSAAVNHLLATDPTRLDTDLRLRTAQLALENRQNTAFPRAIQRLLDAKDPIPADSLSLWTQHLQALKLPTLAQALN